MMSDASLVTQLIVTIFFGVMGFSLFLYAIKKEKGIKIIIFLLAGTYVLHVTYTFALDVSINMFLQQNANHNHSFVVAEAFKENFGQQHDCSLTGLPSSKQCAFLQSLKPESYVIYVDQGSTILARREKSVFGSTVRFEKR